MVQLDVLSGRRAGSSLAANQFPFVVGRNKDAAFRLEEEGVWDHHVALDLCMPDGFVLRANAGALTLVNGEPIQQTILRTGDLIELGTVKLRFSLGQTRQRGLRWREILTWLALAGLCALQIGLVYRLVH